MKFLREQILQDQSDVSTVPKLLDTWRRARTGEGGGRAEVSDPDRRRLRVSWADLIAAQAGQIRGQA